MEEAWDEVSWQDDNELKEWYVEYVAQVNDEKIHHMSILYGVDVQMCKKVYSTRLEGTIAELTESMLQLSK